MFNRNHDFPIFDLSKLLESVESVLSWILRLHVLSFKDLKVLKLITQPNSLRISVFAKRLNIYFTSQEPSLQHRKALDGGQDRNGCLRNDPIRPHSVSLGQASSSESLFSKGCSCAESYSLVLRVFRTKVALPLLAFLSFISNKF